jgi:transposase-like protein
MNYFAKDTVKRVLELLRTNQGITVIQKTVKINRNGVYKAIDRAVKVIFDLLNE